MANEDKKTPEEVSSSFHNVMKALVTPEKNIKKEDKQKIKINYAEDVVLAIINIDTFAYSKPCYNIGGI